MRSNRTPRACEYCGVAFTALASRIREGRGRFCSKTCSALARTPERTPLADRLWAKVVKGGGCWQWTGATLKGGYGVINAGGRGKALLAHRVAYELIRGAIPEGLQIDHLCRNRACVNPAHMEPVPQAVNLRRGRIARGLPR